MGKTTLDSPAKVAISKLEGKKCIRLFIVRDKRKLSF